MTDNPSNPLDYFRLKSLESDSKVSQANMKRAIDSFSSFIGGTDLSFQSFDESLLGEWVSSQLFQGYFSKTVAYNISKIAALYNKAIADGLAQPTLSFSNTLKRIKEIPSLSEGRDHEVTFGKIRDLFISTRVDSFDRQLAKDIIIFGLLLGGLNLTRIADYKKDEYKGDNPEILHIIERYSKPKNKYLFPLRQGKTTPKKISRTIQNLILNILDLPDLSPSADPDFLLGCLWSDIAMSCGISASDIKACLPSGASCLLISCAVASDIDSEKIFEIRNRVNEAITRNPVRWYAMHLRTRVEFKDLTDRLKEKQITLDELYYPMEEIIHKVGKKKIFDHKPVISWLVFYRAKASQLNSLFREVGDLAWGYRYIRDVRSPYAVISHSEISKYQMALGTLSPSTVISTDKEIKLQKGDRLIILGGPMAGRAGTLISEKKISGDPSGRTIYRISLTGSNHINWEVTYDSRLVQKLS